MVNYKVNTENLSLDAYKLNAYKKFQVYAIFIRYIEVAPNSVKNLMFYIYFVEMEGKTTEVFVQNRK